MDRATIKPEIPESIMTDGKIHNSLGTDLTITALYYSGTKCEDVTELKLKSPMTNSVKNEEKMGDDFNDPSSGIISDLVVIAPQEDTLHKCEVFQTSGKPNPSDHKEEINQDITIPAVKQEFMDVVIKKEATDDVSMLEIYNDQIITEESHDCKKSIKLEDDMKDPCVHSLSDVIKTEGQSAAVKNELSVEVPQEDFLKSERFDGDSHQSDDKVSKRTAKPRNHPGTVTATSSDDVSDCDESHPLELCSGQEFDDKEKEINALKPKCQPHRNRRMNNIEILKDAEEYVSCKDEPQIKVNQRLQTGVEPNACATCDQGSKDQHDHKRYPPKLTAEKPYGCNTCTKSFRGQQDLKRHQKRIHTGDKPYGCSICDKSFRDRYGLNHHQRTHTGEKPYACTMCDKSFRVQHDLKCHQRTHTGEKPYACTRCDKSFIVQRDLKRHQRSHTGEKPYACTTCHKSFSVHFNLKRHQRTHTR